MEFVEQDDGNVWEGAVVLEAAEENPFGDIADASAEAGEVVEADLVADLGAEAAAAFPGHAGGNGAGGDAAGLKNQNLFVAGQAGVQEHLGDLGGFARTCGGDEDEAISGAECRQNVRVDLPDGERGRAHTSESEMAEGKRGDGNHQHHPRRHKLMSLGQPHRKDDQQCG